MIPVLCTSGCECLQFLSGFSTWWCQSLALQFVSHCIFLLGFRPDDANSWHSRLWVAVVSLWVSSLFLPLALQTVSDYSSLLDLKPDDANPWLFRLSVAAVSLWILWLMIAILGSPVCEWPQFLWVLSLMIPILDSPVCEWLQFLCGF